jgi:hypothetical protein
LLRVQKISPTEVTFNGADLQVADGSNVPNGQALLCVRPHALRVVDNASASADVLNGVLQSALWQSDHHSLRVDCAGMLVRITAPPLQTPPELGTLLNFSFDPGDATVIPLEHGLTMVDIAMRGNTAGRSGPSSVWVIPPIAALGALFFYL